ncbi:MAG TPA: SRPBCC domain-containing protein [Longimicrobiales bacterium]|nr:SRPBCC domain-containing protein [Longimicrobiales bacterium]
MSTLNVSERFIVPASPDVVWDHLIEPAAVVTCLPGASLDGSSEDGRTHRGSIAIKLGAFSVSYRGEAEFVEVDEEARRLRIKGKGREKTGAGAVSMTMTSSVTPNEGGSEVTVDATIQLAGKIVSFGRGMVDAVAGEVLDAFASCLARKLAGDGEAGAGTASPAPTGSAEGARAGGRPGADGSADASGEAPGGPGTPPRAGARAADGSAGRDPSGAGEEAPQLDSGLLFRAMKSWFKGLFGGKR